jgi:hypothetical protein
MPPKRSILLLLLLALLFGASVLHAQTANPQGSTLAPLPWLYVQVVGNPGVSGQVELSFYDGSGNYYYEPINYTSSDTAANVAGYFAYWFQSDYGNALIAETSNDVLMLQFQTAFSQSNQADFNQVTCTPDATASGFSCASQGMVTAPSNGTSAPASPNNATTVQNPDGSITVTSATPAPNVSDPSGGSVFNATELTTTDGTFYLWVNPVTGVNYLMTVAQANALADVLSGGILPGSVELALLGLTAVNEVTTSAAPADGGGTTVPNNPSQLPDPNNPSTPDPALQAIQQQFTPLSCTQTQTDPDENGCYLLWTTCNDGTTTTPSRVCPNGKPACQSSPGQ